MPTPSRKTTTELLQENQQLVYKAGQLQYLIRQSQKDLDSINDQLVSVNVDYAAARELEAQVAEKMAAEKAKEAEEKSKAEAAKTTQAEQPSPAPTEVKGSNEGS